MVAHGPQGIGHAHGWAHQAGRAGKGGALVHHGAQQLAFTHPRLQLIARLLEHRLADCFGAAVCRAHHPGQHTGLSRVAGDGTTVEHKLGGVVRRLRIGAGQRQDGCGQACARRALGVDRGNAFMLQR
jgi:hypothetical protein